jgi:hypothetical protein
VNAVISSTSFWLATAAIILLIACYILFLVRFKSADESSDFSVFSKLLPETSDSDLFDLLQETSDDLLLETSENLSARRRRELLEKIKEERIKEYLEHKKRK